jgi:hypothetical protein
MTLITCLASKLVVAWFLYLARFTAFGEAPVEIGNALACSFSSEFIVTVPGQTNTDCVKQIKGKTNRWNTSLGANSLMSSYCIRVAHMGQLISFQILVENSD